MHFARWVFRIAGIYGVIVVAPEYFFENRYGIDHPPAITHPEFFYGFVGVCLVFQFLFLMISANPVRFRPVMLMAVLEKLSFAIPAALLWYQDRLPAIVLGFSAIDLVWAALFILSYIKTPAAKNEACVNGDKA